MPPAARVGDPTTHPPAGIPGVVLGPGVPTVLIEKLPAAVLGDGCSFPPPPGTAPPPGIVRGSVTVLIGKRPAARVGDQAACGGTVSMGAVTVMIGG